MNYSDNALNIITTSTYNGIANAWIVKHLGYDEKKTYDIIELLYASKKQDISRKQFEEKKKKIESRIEKLEKSMDGVVAVGDKNFPPYRGQVKASERPIFLFYKGDLSLLKADNKNVAVIGLLEPDSAIETIERKVVKALVNKGATIISGLARGCDTIAHKQTLRSKGKTVAILPSPLNKILPAQNRKLAKEIVEKGGLLITEYYESIEYASNKRGYIQRYIDRDRLQALFSDSIILSASYTKNHQGGDSGSRHAMKYALEYSIPRAVIYDANTDKEKPKYGLNRQVLKEKDEVIPINKKNLVAAVESIMSYKQPYQNGLNVPKHEDRYAQPYQPEKNLEEPKTKITRSSSNQSSNGQQGFFDYSLDK